MSRVSLSRRLQAALEAVENINPQAARVHRMKPATRLRYNIWRAECERVMAEYGDPAAAFAAYLAGEPIMTAEMATAQCAAIYEQFKEGK